MLERVFAEPDSLNPELLFRNMRHQGISQLLRATTDDQVGAPKRAGFPCEPHGLWKKSPGCRSTPRIASLI